MKTSAILELARIQIIKDKVDPFAMDLISEAEVALALTLAQDTTSVAQSRWL